MQSALIDGKALPVREPMARGIFTVAGFDGASCPVLYVRLRGGGDLVKIGSVLTESQGAARPEASKPFDYHSTVLMSSWRRRKSVQCLVTEACEPSASYASPEDRSGSFISLAVPAVSGASYYELRVSGYYDTYSSLFSARGR